jgi:RNA polymerase sigma-70 factor (ECF subfamily)
MAFPFLFATFGDDPSESSAVRKLRVAVSVAPERSDTAIIARLRAGDHEAFDTLYRQYFTALWEFAFRYTRTSEGAEDLVHEVFHSLWARRADLALDVGLRPYLFGAVRNLALKQSEHARVVRTASAHRQEAAGVGRPPEASDAATEASEIERAVDGLLAAMPEARRQVLLLRWRGGMSYEEISTVLHISVAAAQAHVSRAQRAARPLLQRLFGNN